MPSFDLDVRVPLLCCSIIRIWIRLNMSCKMLAVLGWGRTPSRPTETVSWDHLTLLCDRCACEEIQDKVHALLMCRDADVCTLRTKFAYPLFSQISDDFSAKQPSAQVVYKLLLHYHNTLFLCLSRNVLLTDEDQSQIDQPNVTTVWLKVPPSMWIYLNLSFLWFLPAIGGAATNAAKWALNELQMSTKWVLGRPNFMTATGSGPAATSWNTLHCVNLKDCWTCACIQILYTQVYTYFLTVYT